MSRPAKTEIFVSYASEYADTAEDIASVLTIEGYQVFLDRKQLKAAEAYDAPIRTAIQRCHLVVVLFAPVAFTKDAHPKPMQPAATRPGR